MCKCKGKGMPKWALASMTVFAFALNIIALAVAWYSVDGYGYKLFDDRDFGERPCSHSNCDFITQARALIGTGVAFSALACLETLCMPCCKRFGLLQVSISLLISAVANMAGVIIWAKGAKAIPDEYLKDYTTGPGSYLNVVVVIVLLILSFFALVSWCATAKKVKNPKKEKGNNDANVANGEETESSQQRDLEGAKVVGESTNDNPLKPQPKAPSTGEYIEQNAPSSIAQI